VTRTSLKAVSDCIMAMAMAIVNCPSSNLDLPICPRANADFVESTSHLVSHNPEVVERRAHHFALVCLPCHRLVEPNRQAPSPYSSCKSFCTNQSLQKNKLLNLFAKLSNVLCKKYLSLVNLRLRSLSNIFYSSTLVFVALLASVDSTLTYYSPQNISLLTSK
jgi:hypothetical protein